MLSKVTCLKTGSNISLSYYHHQDMADLAKTSRICVLFDTFLVAMIAYYSKFILFCRSASEVGCPVAPQLPVYCGETFEFVLILPYFVIRSNL